ncbi:hypothetical protein V8C86DRAFT_991569 [Haematococcus lacustris]
MQACIAEWHSGAGRQCCSSSGGGSGSTAWSTVTGWQGVNREVEQFMLEVQPVTEQAAQFDGIRYAKRQLKGGSALPCTWLCGLWLLHAWLLSMACSLFAWCSQLCPACHGSLLLPYCAIGPKWAGRLVSELDVFLQPAACGDHSYVDHYNGGVIVHDAKDRRQGNGRGWQQGPQKGQRAPVGPCMENRACKLETCTIRVRLRLRTELPNVNAMHKVMPWLVTPDIQHRVRCALSFKRNIHSVRLWGAASSAPSLLRSIAALTLPLLSDRLWSAQPKSQAVTFASTSRVVAVAKGRRALCLLRSGCTAAVPQGSRRRSQTPALDIITNAEGHALAVALAVVGTQ